MREKRFVNLRKLELPLGQRPNDFFRDCRRNGRGAAIQEICDFSHARNLLKSPKEAKRILYSKNPGCIRANLKQNEALTPKPVFGFITDPIVKGRIYVRCIGNWKQ